MQDDEVSPPTDVGVGIPVDEGRAVDAPRPSRSPIDKAVEEEAIACVRRGQHKEALTKLMVAYSKPLTAFALRILRDPDLAKDVRQQVFLEAFHGIEKFAGRASIWSWLCGIAHNRCIDELRRMKRTPVDFGVLEDLLELPDLSMDNQRSVARRRTLERCLAKLSSSERMQVLMRLLLRLSYAEIGELVHDSPGTVQVRISRILPRLRRCLGDPGDFG